MINRGGINCKLNWQVYLFHRRSDIIGLAGDLPIDAIKRVITFLSKMGLSVRDDPKKVVDVAGRQWGEPVDGLALSVLLRVKEDADELPSVSVAIHNRSAETQRLTTPGWLHFFRVSVLGPDGAEAALSPYGRELMKPERRPISAGVALAPGEAIEADIPIGQIFQLRAGPYRVHASCRMPGGPAVSNEIRIP
jgi:hypothetical protein